MIKNKKKKDIKKNIKINRGGGSGELISSIKQVLMSMGEMGKQIGYEIKDITGLGNELTSISF